MALEDKLLAEELWTAAGVPAAPSRIVPVDRTALAAAADEVAGPLGSVWSGDARGGFNGGGNFVRWVTDEHEAAAAFAFFAPRCDRVRVLPFLDGVPCSIHGMVLPDGTAVFRPVEIAMLRDPVRHRFVYGGLGTFWDPPAADRDEMRDVARRVGEQLRAAYGYRGGFGVDGVLTADGFRPTELNSRMSAGLSTVAAVDRAFMSLLQTNLLAGVDTGLDVVRRRVPRPPHGRPPDGPTDRAGRAAPRGRGPRVPGRLGRTPAASLPRQDRRRRRRRRHPQWWLRHDRAVLLPAPRRPPGPGRPGPHGAARRRVRRGVRALGRRAGRQA